MDSARDSKSQSRLEQMHAASIGARGSGELEPLWALTRRKLEWRRLSQVPEHQFLRGDCSLHLGRPAFRGCDTWCEMLADSANVPTHDRSRTTDDNWTTCKSGW